MKIEEIGRNETIKKESVMATLVETEKQELVPAGYVPIVLSTKGKVGAPEKFHIRNFKTKDIMSLALTEEEALPERLVSLLQDLIYEKDVDVKKFHENEIIETMLLLYHSFYSDTIEIPFPLEEADYEDIRSKFAPAAAEEKIRDLTSGRWKPVTMISISKDIDTYDLPADFSPTAVVKSKQTGFTLGFRLPYYGDTLLVKKWLRETFGEAEKKFQRTAKVLEIQERMLREVEQGKQISWDTMPRISEEEQEAYNNFRIQRAGVIVDIVRALHLCVYDGEDVSHKPLSERYEMIQDPRIDERVARKLDAHFEEMEFGVKPEVRMINPLTKEVCQRRYSFRLVDILQAASVSTDDDYEFISSV